MRSFQPQPVLIDDYTHTMSAAQTQRTVKIGEKLAEKTRQLVNHVTGFVVAIDLDPTFTTAPTIVELSKALANLIFKADSGRVAVNLSGPDLRAMEAYENGGKLVVPDADLTSGSTNNFYATRYVNFAPLGYAGGDDDFALPVALLGEATLDLTYPAFTDVSADGTAGTVRVRIFAMCVGLNRVNIPPKFDLRSFAAAGNAVELGERSLITHALLCDSAAHAAITAGDFANLSFRDREGDFLSAVPAAVLTSMYWAQNRTGQLGIIQGEPQAATDDNLKIVNGASPTAVVGASAAYQPVLWSAQGARIGQNAIETPGRLSWTGTQATGHLLVRRILPRSAEEAKEAAERAFRRCGIPFKGIGIRTLDRRPYVGDAAEYMPWDGRFR